MEILAEGPSDAQVGAVRLTLLPRLKWIFSGRGSQAPGFLQTQTSVPLSEPCHLCWGYGFEEGCDFASFFKPVSHKVHADATCIEKCLRDLVQHPILTQQEREIRIHGSN